MGVMIPMKRERMLTIRVTDDEHARLLERCEGKQLAVWMRRDQRKMYPVSGRVGTGERTRELPGGNAWYLYSPVGFRHL